MSFCRACFRMFPYICKEQITSVTTILDYTTNKNLQRLKKNGFAQYAVIYTKVMKLLNSVLNASSRRVNLKKW